MMITMFAVIMTYLIEGDGEWPESFTFTENSNTPVRHKIHHLK